MSAAGVQPQPQQAPQAGTQGQGQGQQTQNQAFLNPPLPPGYGYTGKEKCNVEWTWCCQKFILACCLRLLKFLRSVVNLCRLYPWHFCTWVPFSSLMLDYSCQELIFFLHWKNYFFFFLHPNFTGLPYYAGVPGVPSAFQYGPTVFVPPASAKQPTMGLANPSNQYHQQHQPSYGQHAYGAGKTRAKPDCCLFQWSDVFKQGI